ncbi:MAG: putative manganese-dependent inorganic diphosphatase [Negativicutes bacterium]|nr:putative manganese-dependent inorganic diphosphatase [Negativicutes bacterium]
MSKPIWVIGHRNPDTDSICSAIGYAHLKQAMGEPATPARAGKINPETRFVLDFFGVEAPALVDDLYPRAQDIMNPVVATVRPGDTLRELGRVMKGNRIKSVPVMEEDGRLAGMVSVGDLAQKYFDELEMQDLREAGVTFAGVLRALDGALLCGGGLDRQVPGKVWIGAARSQTMATLIGAGDVVLVGNRDHAQMTCVRRGIACLVVTGGAPVLQEVCDAAAANGAIVISSPYDTYTCARLINQSVPVRMAMQAEVVGFKPGDLVADIKNIIVRTNHRNYPVIESGRLIGMIDRDRLIMPKRVKVILVDHNERSQAVEGVEEAHIVEIIDHHRLGGLETGEPIFIRHEPVGSTATIVANMHWHRNIAIPATIAGLLLAGVLSDTYLFRSPTASPKDKETATQLAALAGLDIEEFGMALLKAGSGIGNLSPQEIIRGDLKEFQIGEHRVAIGQISVLDPAEILAAKSQLQEQMKIMSQQEDCDLVMLMVTDILKECSHLIYTGPAAALVDKTFGSKGEDGVLYLPGVMSRKKQVVPPMVEATRS